MVRLIVNADDFGISELTNKGIVDAIRHGIVTSTSILANGDAFDSAVKYAQKFNLSAGVHLNLTFGKSLSNAESLGNALSENNLKKAMLGMLDKEDIKLELGEQIDKVIDSGILPTHLDGHKHIHIMPKVIDAVIELAKEYKIKCIRLPLARMGFAGFFPAGLKYNIVNFFARLAKHKIEKAGLKTTSAFYGLLETGKLNKDKLKKILVSIKEDTAELMCHPGYYDKHLASGLKASREIELRALTSSEIKEVINKKNISLISYGDL